MSTINETSQWKSLEEHKQSIEGTHLRQLLADEDRCASCVCEFDGILLDYSRERVLPQTMDMLFDLANVARLDHKIAAMAAGQHVNSTENRAALHYALRVPKDFGKKIVVDGADVLPQVHKVLDEIDAFSTAVREKRWLGATGKPLTNVISIGIGGSYLGPEFVHEALKTDVEARVHANGRSLKFLANVDPVDMLRAIGVGTQDALNAENTLVVVVSKTFTTAETLLNARTVRDWLQKCMPSADGASVVRQHMVAVSSAKAKAAAFGIDTNNVFEFWDWVGGRYSVCSAVGMLPLSLQYSSAIMQQFLHGAHTMDKHFFECPLRFNLPVNLGLVGVWNSSFLGFSSRAILPYSQALSRFAAHIQQVDMESNGKRVTADGLRLPFECGEINFGEPGTNGQHSFYQLLHQGRVVPAEFIGFCESQNPIKLSDEVISNHDELMCNFFAQPDALALGKTIAELEKEGVPAHLCIHKEFSGNRPSLSILFPRLCAHSLGQLLALYEHRVCVQGFVWGINSFDQWGVELGKVLALKIRSHIRDARAAAALTGEVAVSTSATAGTSELVDNEREAVPTGLEPVTAPGDSFQGLNPSTTYLLKRYIAYQAAGQK